MAPTSLTALASRPLVPNADNFTPATRTPWGGHAILQRYKAHLGIETTDVVGESWEISGHPSFPNCFDLPEGVVTIAEIEAQSAEALYGPGQRTMPFLVKLLHSRENLSVQVHPRPGDVPGKPAKTEAWWILDAEPGAGVYLGLAPGVTSDRFLGAMEQGQNLAALLNFVPVLPGEVYLVPAGTLHAIGAGVLLLEPQETSETTFRAYDWGRGRELHQRDVVLATDWDAPKGRDLIEHLRREPQVVQDAGPRVELLVDGPQFQLHRLVFRSVGERLASDTEKTGFQGLTVLEGQVEVRTPRHTVTIMKGQSRPVPAALGSFEISSMAAPAAIAQVTRQPETAPVA